MEEVQARLLEKALRFYEALLHEKDDPDLAIRGDTARAFLRTAEIYYLLGRLDRAEEHSRQAVTRYEQLAREFPDEERYRRDWASALGVRTDVLDKLWRREEAVGAARQAITLLEKLPLDQPRYRLDLAEKYKYLGIRTTSDRPQAEELLQRARALLEDGGRAGSGPRGAAYLLSEIYLSLGMLYQEQHHSGEAEAAYQKALKLGETAVAEARWIGFAHANLAKVYHNLAALRWGEGRLPDAEELFLEALKRRQEVVRLHPRNAVHGEQLAMNLETLAAFYEQANRLPDAAARLREAVAVLEPLAGPGRDPGLSPIRVARDYLALGHFLDEQKKTKEAQDCYLRSIAILEAAQRAKPLEENDLLLLRTAYLVRMVFWVDCLKKVLPGRGFDDLLPL
jgi:tetratricopeptide (TPR) repeat protein